MKARLTASESSKGGVLARPTVVVEDLRESSFAVASVVASCGIFLDLMNPHFFSRFLYIGFLHTRENVSNSSSEFHPLNGAMARNVEQGGGTRLEPVSRKGKENRKSEWGPFSDVQGVIKCYIRGDEVVLSLHV
jgi:hypothetical protein